MAPLCGLLDHEVVLTFVLACLLSGHVAVSLPQDAVRALVVPTKDGSYGSLEETLYAASILSATKDPSLDADKLCKWAGSVTLPSPPPLASASALARLSTLVCPQAPQSLGAVESALVKGALEATSVKDVYLAVQGIAALKVKGFAASDYNAAAAASANLLESLKESTGFFRADKEADETSALATGLALKSIAALLSIDASSYKPLTSDVKTLFGKAAAGESRTAFFKADPEEGGPLPVTSLISSAYFEIAAALGDTLSVSKDLVAGLGNFLATSGAPVSLLEASFLFEALAAFDSNSIVVPVLLAVPGHFSVSHPPPAVSLTTVLGRPVEDATVTLASVKVVAKGTTKAKEVAQGKVLTPQGSSFALPSDVFGPSAALGTYTLKFEVSSAAPAQVPLSPATRSLATTAPIALSAVSVAVLDSDAATPETDLKVDLASTSKQELRTVSATHLQQFKVSLTATSPDGKPFAPHQAFLTLRHESGVEHVFLLKSTAKELSISLNLLENLAKLYYLSGVYSVKLTLGDAFMENSGTWQLCSVSLELPDPPEGAAKPPVAAVALALEERFQPAKEIEHIFRVPDKRPPLLVSYAFAALVLLPFLLLLVGFAALGVNLKLLPTSGLPFLSAVGFHGGIGAILLLYFAFWVEVKLFTTLKLLVFLALITAVPGHYILSFLADSTAKVKTS